MGHAERWGLDLISILDWLVDERLRPLIGSRYILNLLSSSGALATPGSGLRMLGWVASVALGYVPGSTAALRHLARLGRRPTARVTPANTQGHVTL